MKRYVVVGNGIAGHRAAIELKGLDPDATVTLVGSEPGLPYDRPPLTKDFLLGKLEPDDLTLKGADAYGELGIVYRPSSRVVAIDRGARRVVADDGGELGYDALLLATGSRPRLLDKAPPSRSVHYIRTLPDAVRLRSELVAGRHVVIVGGGFIGLEVASSARSVGCSVSVVETADRLLSRGMPALVSRYVHDLHARHGVGIVLGDEVQDLTVDDHGGVAVQLRNGIMRADVVVLGIGVLPNQELAAEAGLVVRDGIVVDRQCRTSDPSIFAAGEVTVHPTGGNGTVRRVESWRLSAEQPLIAAASMVGRETVFDDPPWLWSDQFSIHIQMIGAPNEGRKYLFRGSAEDGRWTLISVDEEGRPIGAVGINNGRDISMLRRVLRSGQMLPESFAGDFQPVDDQESTLEAMGLAHFADT